MKDNHPIVSVVMATYNGEKYIREQLDSIIAQTYPIYELIIQDDCSNDSTPSICKEYEAKYPFIRFYQNEHNLGFNLNFKTAAMRATGDLVALSDQDDIWFPKKIEKQVKAIGNYDICTSSYTRGKDIKSACIFKPQYSFEALLFNAFVGHTMMMHRFFCQNSDNWNPLLPYDWSLEINAALNNGICCVDEPLNWHRSHDEETGSLLKRKYIGGEKHVSYQPYLYGWKNYRSLQKDPVWNPLYSFLYSKTKGKTKYKRVHTMTSYMLSRSPLSLVWLCWSCMLHRDIIYPQKTIKGFMGIVRGFFYPFIFAYNNYQYKLVDFKI